LDAAGNPGCYEPILEGMPSRKRRASAPLRVAAKRETLYRL
jgi:hypothetical protein